MPRGLTPPDRPLEPRPTLLDFKPYDELKSEECAPSHSPEGGVGSNVLGHSSVNLPADSRRAEKPHAKMPTGVHPTLGKRVALYLRVSSTRQAEEGLSLEGQERDARAYCDRMGYSVRYIVRDVASGTTTDRPGLHRVLTLADRGSIDLVVIWKRDRIGRDVLNNALVDRDLRAAGVRVEAIDTGPSTDSDESELMVGILDVFSRHENKKRAARTLMGRLEAARRGYWPTKALYGYRKEGKRLAIDLEKAQKVREAYRECIRGSNRARIALVLGCDPRSSCRMLRNPAYKGQAVYGGIPVPCPAIVEEHVWQEAQDAIDARFRGCDDVGRLLKPSPNPK